MKNHRNELHRLFCEATDRLPRRTGRIVVGCLAAALALTSIAPTAAQETPREPDNGMRERELRIHAITGAKIVISPTETIEQGTIVIRDGVIAAVGPDDAVTVPREARVWSGEGRTIYPGFIDAAVYSDYPPPSDSAGRYWNERIFPELIVADRPAPPDSLREQLRRQGFTAAAFYPSAGILRGTGAVISTDGSAAHLLTYQPRGAMAASFERGGFRGYPGSLMGVIALTRQVMHDAQWYAEVGRVYQDHPQGNEPPRQEDSLAALADVIAGRQPVLMETTDEHNAIRAKRLLDEFGLEMWIQGSGYEFRRLQEIVDLNCPIIVTLNFPNRPDVNGLHEAEKTTLADLMTWEQGPTNPRRLVEAGATIMLTTEGARPRFHEALRNAVRHGLSETDALAALTVIPAQMYGLDDVMGTIERGKLANLVVMDGSLFKRQSKVHDVWVNGRRHVITAPDTDVKITMAGTLETSLGVRWPVQVNTERKTLTIELPPAEVPVDADAADADVDADVDEEKKAEAAKPRPIRSRTMIVQREQVSVVIDGEPFDATGYVHLGGVVTEGTIVGTGLLPSGERFTFSIEPAPDLAEGEPAAGRAERPRRGERPAAAGAADADNADDLAADAAEPQGINGTWQATADTGEVTMPLTLDLTQNGATVSGMMAVMDMEFPLDGGSYDARTGEVRFAMDTPGGQATIVARINGETMTGQANSQMGTLNFQGRRQGGRRGGQDAGGSDAGQEGRAAGDRPARGGGNDEDTFEMPPAELPVPFGGYGLFEEPQSQSVLVHSATIWTAGPQGIIENGWMLVQNGKITQMGTGGYPKIGVDVVIDASGKHISPGLIDCHSHTGITGGVNEGSQVNTAEVRIDDVIDPDDINWYRQLAGGLTAANQLHGSANPIGGQNSVVKLKWGGTAEDFRVEDDHVGIKFALGENVVRSTGRYPNTRMGVDTIIRDAFTAAQEYQAEWDRYHALPSDAQARTYPPRRDLTLDTLVEILNGERLIHCHSYRQDEILMLMRLAESFGFRIGTFQHILEGYKVGEVMAEHGVMASSFSDWWGYKVEVMDAIPYNGALLHELGVVVSFNSDSSELARRMNDEAAKAVRYGGVEPNEALKFVTLNAAKQVGVDHRTGSLEVGKDADFVIWSASPLSSYARCEQTWIEGACYFSDEMHAELRAWTERERLRLIQKVLADAHGTPDSAKPAEKQADEEADTPSQPVRIRDRILAERVNEAVRWMEEQVRLGHDPMEVRPGVCGCNDYWFALIEAYTTR